MENLYVNISKRTRMVNLPRQFIAVDGENLQNRFVFKFEDEFVDGVARLEYEMEYEIEGEKSYILLEKQGESYVADIKNILTKTGQINMQLVITENSIEDEIPVFKSNIFYLHCNASINAVEEAPEGYELWIETANAKLNEIENVDIDMQDTTITITRKDGTQKSVLVQGEPGVTPNIQVGETKTLEPTQMALVTRMGTDENPIFEFSIPRGKDGEDGGVSTEEVQEMIDSSLENIETGVSIEEVEEAISEALEDLDTGSGLIELREDTDITQLKSGIYIAKGKSIEITFATSSRKTFTLDEDKMFFWNHNINGTKFAVKFDYYGTSSSNYELLIDYYINNSGTGTSRQFSSNLLVNTMGSQNISGTKTFVTLPETSLTPTKDKQFVNKAYVDNAIANAITTALEGEY